MRLKTFTVFIFALPAKVFLEYYQAILHCTVVVHKIPFANILYGLTSLLTKKVFDLETAMGMCITGHEHKCTLRVDKVAPVAIQLHSSTLMYTV